MIVLTYVLIGASCTRNAWLRAQIRSGPIVNELQKEDYKSPTVLWVDKRLIFDKNDSLHEVSERTRLSEGMAQEISGSAS